VDRLKEYDRWSLRHRRPRRWPAPVTALLCAGFLTLDRWWWGLRAMTDLEAGRGLTARHAIATADQILAVGSVLVLALGVAGAVRPVRRAALYVLGATAVVLTVTWLATRADVAYLHLQRTLP
jgi:hypothetical protein